ncbi:MAG: response regulator [Candidatus Eisenbacteria bacterium]|nr:response regulator [Candidatus Eisenbacteria bacterium]
MTAALSPARILVVDDEAPIRDALRPLLEGEGYEVLLAPDLAAARRSVEETPPDALLLDVRLPDGDGVAFLEWIGRRVSRLPVVMISGQADIATAVKAIRQGAVDFLEKPLASERVLVAVRNALRIRRLENENLRLREAAGLAGPFIAESEEMEATLRDLVLAARSEVPVLLLGESGTGKERLARFLHERSPRKDQPFVAVNAAAIPRELMESELFGHEKGAFTGAVTRRQGRFQAAHGGTLFLDEIGDMPDTLQAKLLRVLESGAVEPLGARQPVEVDVRVVSATHRELSRRVEEGAFRLDLYHRLAVLIVRIPPLRRRPDDIRALARHFLRQLSRVQGLPPRALSPAAETLLLEHSWPGNVRELRNLMERVLIFARSDEVDAGTLEQLLAQNPSAPAAAAASPAAGAAAPGPSPRTYREHLARWEKAFLTRILDDEDWNVARAAARLGLDRSHLHRKLRDHGLRRPESTD